MVDSTDRTSRKSEVVDQEQTHTEKEPQEKLQIGRLGVDLKSQAYQKRLQDFQKQISLTNSKISLQVGIHGHVREVTENWTTIVFHMKWSLLGIVLNIFLMVVFNLIRQTLLINVVRSVIESYLGVVVEVILLLSNAITIMGLEEAASCTFGYLLSSKKGFSMAVCGYLHVAPLAKLSFAQSLSLTSPSRKILSRISIIWIILELFKVLTPISAISVIAEAHADFNDVSDCIYFVQDNKIKAIDRKWPNLDAEGGVAEYVFGSSLGWMRSEMSVNITTAMYPPQLISALNNGDTIEGLGFSADILTTCKCAANVSSTAFVAAGVHFSQGIKLCKSL
ncbi:hypothetical protein BCR33DRAFT_421843 [Rhizoclosmatium globosum]|uniref:Uncharacterized protein n=1 Tax=Rhizoclosmatium globosum TaxID=329046 RepID=A0A1Y2BVP6_9FUNG|nr:hypothetical protein BCR33DRAFT_421843 [Rhizoclosmatium globosum]|eukprot:ORY38829.1 hypothetical protein BCR33DRAFT_421843 [Rhizoclosmatium globosum]